MVEKDRQHSWSEYLDKEKQNLLVVRYVFSEDFKEPQEFAAMYLMEIGQKMVEVVRYDCSATEGVNIHKFYCRPAEKIHLNKQKSFDTLNSLIEDIERNWRLYRARFLEK